MKVKYVQEHISSCSGTVGTYVDTNLRTPPSASSLGAHAGIGGSGRWPGWGRYPGAFRERGCNLRPARQRKDGANRDTDGGRNQQHSYSAHYQLYPTDGGVRFGSLTTSRSIQMLNNQLFGRVGTESPGPCPLRARRNTQPNAVSATTGRQLRPDNEYQQNREQNA
jgi:hypothetical protein